MGHFSRGLVHISSWNTLVDLTPKYAALVAKVPPPVSACLASVGGEGKRQAVHACKRSSSASGPNMGPNGEPPREPTSRQVLHEAVLRVKCCQGLRSLRA